MDSSGLDHDFLTHKYEASLYTGTVNNGSPDATSAYPLQALAGASTWTNNARSCYELLQRTGSLNVTACGNGSIVNASSALLQKKPDTTPQVSIDQGAFWKGCANTGITDGSGNVYYERLPTDSEWMKAADWGDVTQPVTIMQTQFASALRGFAKSSGGATVSNNGDYQWYTTTLSGSVRGGNWNNGSQSGRWSLNVNTNIGGRCSR